MSTIPTVSLLLAVLVQAPALLAQEDARQVGLGAKVYAENCNRCHEAFSPTTHDGNAWKAISLHMRLFADLSRTEQAQVLAFLRAANTAKKN
jgi:cytochrome c1